MSQTAVVEGLNKSAVTAVEQIFPNLKAKVFSYALENDFEKLWSFKSLPADRIVIVWGRTATDSDLAPINAADCLSPLDWAAAYVKSLSGNAAAWPETLILDVAPESNSKVPTVAHFETLRSEQLPWLTVCKHPGLHDILEWLGRTRSFSLAKETEKYSSDCRTGLNRFLREIRLNLTELKSDGGYDRHAISNIIGPMILRGSAARKTLHSDALLQLVKACGLYAAPIAVQAGDAPAGDGRDEAVTHAADSGAERESGAGLQILLVDDQAEHGWKDWIEETLPEATVRYLTNPIGLVDAVKRQLDAAGSKDLRFRLQLPLMENAERPVLLLDLRLFSGNPKGECDFYQDKLLPIIDKLKDLVDLAWPPFNSNDSKFKAARFAIETRGLKLESQEHHEALTWLPRIVSQIDMSLPVVLFSSTGRRGLVEPLKAHHNILTCFDKLRLNGVVRSSDARGHTQVAIVYSLRTAVAEARHWLTFRNVANKAMLIAEALRAESNASSAKHFEIHFDESGSSRANGFRMAALVVGYQEQEHARKVAETMQAKGVSWFGNKGAFCYNKDFARTPHDVQRLGEKFAPEMQDLWVMPLVLWSNPDDMEVVSDAFNADTLIQSIVGEILELCLFVLLPRNSECTYVIHGAQRRIEIQGATFEVNHESSIDNESSTLKRAELEKLGVNPPDDVRRAIEQFKSRWGVPDSRIEYTITPSGKDEEKKIFTALRCKVTFLSIASAQDYGAILARTFQTRPWATPWKEQAHQIGLHLSPLNHWERASLAGGDRPIHIVADILPGDATWDNRGANLNAVADMLPRNGSPSPVLIAEGAELSRLLAVGRTLDGADYAHAWANAVSLTDDFVSHAQFLYQATWALFASKLNAVSGTHLVNAFNHLKMLPPARRGSLPFSRINIRHQHWTQYPRPDSATIIALQDYCRGKLLADFGVAPEKLEKNVADWVLCGAIAGEYPGRAVKSTEWLRDKQTNSLFAIVSYSDTGSLPFRQVSRTIPSALRPDRGLNFMVIKLSIGPIPLGRLELKNGKDNVGWIDAESARLTDYNWSQSQCEATANSSFKRIGPLSLEEIRQVTAVLVEARWSREVNSSQYFAYADSEELGRIKAHLHRNPRLCEPFDFSVDGQFLHYKQAWPSGPHRTNHARNSVGMPTVIMAPSPRDPQPRTEFVFSKHLWFGPVPKAIKYELTMKTLKEAFPDWIAERQWVPLGDDCWVPLTPKDLNSPRLPTTINLVERHFRITDKDPRRL